MPPPVPPRAYDWVFLLPPPEPLERNGADVAAADGASEKCLLITDAYGRLMQVVLALTALVVLSIKRKLETPMRPLRVWALDVGKQCCGAFLIHCLSIVLSIVFVAGADKGDDECGVYFATYMLDTTWGIVVILTVLQLEQALAERLAWHDLVESGFYGEPPRLAIWCKQVAAYACAVLTMKLLDSLIILYYYDVIAHVATNLFRSFTNHRHLELLLVMIIIPGCCNSFQFWIVDSYLKCDGSHWKYFSTLVTSDDEQQQLQKGGGFPVSPLVDDGRESQTLIVGTALPPQLYQDSSGKSIVSYDTANPATPLTLSPSKTTATRPGMVL